MAFWSNLGNGIKDGITNATGHVEKAIIYISDDSYGVIESAQLVDSAGLTTADSTAGKLTGLAGMDRLESALDGNLQSISDLTKLSEAAGKMIKSEGKKFVVQFNPSSLTFNGRAGGVVPRQNYGRPEDGGDPDKKELKPTYEVGPAPLSVTLDVDLIFNKVYPNDAFLENKIAPTVSNIRGAASVINTVSGNSKGYSVQKEIEGFIAATRIYSKTLISFNWGKLYYTGMIDRLEAEYKMFNPKGEPIYGVVHLALILVDEGVNESSLGNWYESYMKAFSNGSMRAGSTAQKALGSFLNLPT